MVNIFTDPKARKTPCSIALPKEIRRSRTPTKSDKRHAGLVRALMANKARMESNRCLVIDASFMEQPALDPSPNKPKLEREQQERQQENLQDPAVDPIFEDLIKPELERYKEPPPPEPDFEIIDEGKTERNPYDKSGREEVFK